MSDRKYQSAFSATLSGIANLFQKSEPFGSLNELDGLEGKVCMITGANSGLGLATSIHLAKLGAEVIMICRSGIPEAGELVKRESGSSKVRMLHVDLSDYHSIVALCDRLVKDRVKVDVFISNAAVVPGGSRKTKQGFEHMFMVNYMAPFILINRLIDEEVISKKSEEFDPRIIVVSSESHRSGKDLELDKLGVYEDFKMSQVVSLYGYYKLALNTFVEGLIKKLSEENKPISVHSLCPGAVNSNIAREAPKAFQPLLRLVFKLFFQDPIKAAEPVVYLAASKKIEGQNGVYLHMWSRKEADDRTKERSTIKGLWERSKHLTNILKTGGA